MTNHGLDHLNEKAPVVGFPGTGGALALNQDGEIPIVPTYHGMPGPNNQPQSSDPWPEHPISPQQQRVQQENAMAGALKQAGLKAPAAKGLGKEYDSQFDPNSTIHDALTKVAQYGGYDPTHIAAATGQQFPHYHDTPAGQASLAALKSLGMPTPDRDTNKYHKLNKDGPYTPPAQTAVAGKYSFVRRITPPFVRSNRFLG
jgi:hypothetical protein